MTDAQLAVLSQSGDREAFGALASRWDGRLFGFLRRLMGDEEEARDLCQEALLKAYLNIGRLREPQHFKAWVHQIAINLCRDRGRTAGSRKLREVGLDEADVEETHDEGLTPLDVAEQKDLGATLGAVLARLSTEQRTAILLRELQGFNSSEIAEITGVPAATVRGRIFYGLKALRRMLREHGVGGNT